MKKNILKIIIAGLIISSFNSMVFGNDKMEVQKPFADGSKSITDNKEIIISNPNKNKEIIVIENNSNQETTLPNLENNKKEDNYIRKIGKVVKVVSQKDMKRILVKLNDTGELVAYNFYSNPNIFRNNTMISEPNEGDSVVILYNKNTPSTDSLPPQINADVLLVLTKENQSAIIDKFNKSGLSYKGDFIVSYDQNTVIINKDGKIIKDFDMNGKLLAVYYNLALESYPAQIRNANIIIELEDKEILELDKINIQQYIDSLTQEQIYVKNNVTYVKLTDATEKFGFTATWNNETQGIIISKDNNICQIKIGENLYTYNDISGNFATAPILFDSKTYIELDFLLKIVAK